jgi:uncharacterized protein YabN with tetrapyrrole methylase and pyrophosphatase domain
VLFQVVFLSLLLEERGEGDFAAVAEHCRQKLIRRHPHVFGNVEAGSAAEVLRNWDQIKREDEGRGEGEIFGDVPESLPGTLYARKAMRRAGSEAGYERPTPEQAVGALGAGADRVRRAGSREERFEAVGDLLFAAVGAARALDVDPEIALRAATDRFRAEIEQNSAPDG